MKVWLQKLICSLLFLVMAFGCGVATWGALSYLGGLSAAICFITLPIGAACLAGSVVVTCCSNALGTWRDDDDDLEKQVLCNPA